MFKQCASVFATLFPHILRLSKSKPFVVRESPSSVLAPRVRPGAPSSVLVTTSKALVTSSDALVPTSVLAPSSDALVTSSVFCNFALTNFLRFPMRVFGAGATCRHSNDPIDST